MKSLLLVFVFIIVHIPFNAQIISHETLVSAGETYSNSYAQISWTLGGIQSTTYNNGDVIITQGFMQSDLSVTTISKHIEDNNYSVKVYPNPVKDNLNIKFDPNNKEDLLIYLYNITGKQILTKTLKNNNKIETINFKKLNNGIYFLKTLSSDGKYSETFKIVFQN